MSEPVVTTKEAAANRKSWAKKFKQGYARHCNSRELETLDPDVLELRRTWNLDDDDVINAIGTFWIALKREGSVFGYGDASLFKNGRDGHLGLLARGVVPNSKKFIMPLLFTADEHKAMAAILKKDRKPTKTPSPGLKPHGVIKSRSGKAKDLAASSKHIASSALDPECIGHFLLAISTKEEDDSISTTLLDSCPGQVDLSQSTPAYRGLVTHSGWLGLNISSNGTVTAAPRTPNFTATLTPTVPAQQGYNTCGLYVILNAWASMLEIPITANQHRRVRGWRSHKEFLSKAFDIVNLALRGYMDSSTVKAFMIVYGYADQYPERDVVQVDATRMEKSTPAHGSTLEHWFEEQRGDDMARYLP